MGINFRSLVSAPIVEGVTAHSIIAVEARDNAGLWDRRAVFPGQPILSAPQDGSDNVPPPR